MKSDWKHQNDARATDQKTLSKDEGIKEEEKQHLQQNTHATPKGMPLEQHPKDSEQK